MKSININHKTFIKLIICLGILIRFIFILYTPIDAYQIDSNIPIVESEADYQELYNNNFTKTVNSTNTSYEDEDNGHFSYILYIYKSWKLPNSNDNQLYHPPLNAFLSAVLLKSLDFTPLSAKFKIESLQFLPFLYSSLTLIFIKKILDKFELSDNSQAFVLMICAFNPVSIIFSGSITNDALVTLFGISSIYLLIKWYQKPTFKNIMLLAIPLGLGANTKHSILVNYIITGCIFLIKLKKEKDLKLIWHYFVFSFALIPITFAYPIRNYILFNQIPFAVQPANSVLYIGNYSLWEQFKPFDKTLLTSSFGLNDHNLFANVVKTSVNSFWFADNFIIVITYFVSITLLIISMIGIIALLQNQKNNIHIKFSIFVTSLWIFSFIMLNLTMSYSCSANARYILIPIIFFGIQLGFILDYLKNNKIKDFIKLLIISYASLSIVVLIIYTFFYQLSYLY